jgi:hypothetical protein
MEAMKKSGASCAIGWSVEVVQVLKELTLVVAEVLSAPSPSQIPGLEERIKRYFLAEVFGSPVEGTQTADAPAAVPVTGRSRKQGFGLRFDRDWHEIRREGFENAITNLSRVEWEVLSVLDEKGGALAKSSELEGAWERLDLDRPSMERIYKVISMLRRTLECVGLGIQNSPGDGYRLIELPTD